MYKIDRSKMAVGRALPPVNFATGKSARPTETSGMGRRFFRDKKGSAAGFSLLEMMVVFALATGLAFMSLRLLDAVSSLREGTRAEMQTFRDLRRLADQLRKDIHRADEAQTTDDESGLVLTRADGDASIHYQVVESVIRRMAETGTSGEVVSREGFRLPREAGVQWQVDAEASLVRLQVTSQRPRGPSFSIESVLNAEDQQ